jgi:hypothetical protein
MQIDTMSPVLATMQRPCASARTVDEMHGNKFRHVHVII